MLSCNQNRAQFQRDLHSWPLQITERKWTKTFVHSVLPIFYPFCTLKFVLKKTERPTDGTFRNGLRFRRFSVNPPHPPFLVYIYIFRNLRYSARKVRNCEPMAAAFIDPILPWLAIQNRNHSYGRNKSRPRSSTHKFVRVWNQHAPTCSRESFVVPGFYRGSSYSYCYSICTVPGFYRGSSYSYCYSICTGSVFVLFSI